LVLTLLLACAAGCGVDHGASVSGTVTLDEQPLTSGAVTFHPASNTGAAAYGQIDSTGRYTLSTGSEQSLAPGQYVATVVATEAAAPPPADNKTLPQTPKLLTPPRYGNAATSDLKFEVVAGSNTIPLELKSGS
jgi:hypothetical protein